MTQEGGVAPGAAQIIRNYVQVSPPESFDFSNLDGWPDWKTVMGRYFTISKLNDADEKEKIDTFLYIMGKGSEPIFKKFPENKKATLASVLEEFDKYFKPHKNVIFDRFLFNSRKQMPGESIETFITDLYSLIEKCDYGNLKDELLRDRIVVGMSDSKTSEILQLKADLTLSEAVKIARSAEMQHKYTKVIREKESESDDETKTKEVNFTGKFNSGGKNNTWKKRDQRRNEETCYFCGESRHPRKDCPARDVVCHNCKVKGHFRKVCKREIRNIRAFEKYNDEEDLDGDVKFIGNCNNVNKKYSDPWLLPIQIEEMGREFSFMLDTGADCICFPTKYIKKFKPDLLDKIKPTKDVLIGPDRCALKNVDGILNLTLKYKTKNKKFTIYLLKNLKYPILSREAIGLLGLMKCLYINSLSSKVAIDKEFPRLLRDMGDFKGKVHIKLNEGYVPFAQSVPRPVPIPL